MNRKRKKKKSINVYNIYLFIYVIVTAFHWVVSFHSRHDCSFEAAEENCWRKKNWNGCALETQVVVKYDSRGYLTAVVSGRNVAGEVGGALGRDCWWIALCAKEKKLRKKCSKC